MGTSAIALGEQAFERGAAAAQEIGAQERRALGEVIANAGLDPALEADAMGTLYRRDPSAMKQHVENLFRRLGGKQPKPTPMAYPAQSTTTQTPALTLHAYSQPVSLPALAPIAGQAELSPVRTTAPGQPRITRGPGIAGAAAQTIPGMEGAGITLPAPRAVTVSYPGARTQAERLRQDLAQARSKSDQAMDLYQRKADFDRQQVQQNIQEFADTYRRITGKDPSPDLMQAFTISALGGDKVLSVMEQQETRKDRQEYQNATLQLRKAQQALNQAKFEASQNPDNPAFRLKLQQANTAFLRAHSYWVSAQARVFGAVNGEPLAGAMLDAEGDPIGAEFQSNVRPTGTQRERATLATSALEQMNDVLSVLGTRPGLFGPGGGQMTELNRWLGTSDPDAQRVRVAAGTAADHLAGVFGGRNQEALQFLREVAGGNVTMNPRAMQAGIEQLKKAAKTIQAVGSYSTVGGGAPSPTGSTQGAKGPAPRKGQPSSGDDLVKRLRQATSGGQ